MAFVNLHYGDGQLRYESDEFIGGMEIECTGNFNATSEEAGDFILRINNNKIIYVSIDSDKTLLPAILFNYTGTLIIQSCLCTIDGKSGFKASIINKHETKWEDLKDVKYSDLDVKWSSLNYNYHVGNQPYSKRTFIRKNQYSNGEAIGYKDETPYYGHYHTHGDGTMMTGKEHTKDSVNLYYIKKKKKEEIVDEGRKEKKIRRKKKVLYILSEMKKQGVRLPTDLKGVSNPSGDAYAGMQESGHKREGGGETGGGGGAGGTP